MLRDRTAAALLIGLAACSEQSTAPTATAPEPAVKFWDVSATALWNKIARDQTMLLHGGAPVGACREERAISDIRAAAGRSRGP